MTSIGLPSTFPPKSSTAILAAVSLPVPVIDRDPVLLLRDLLDGESRARGGDVHQRVEMLRVEPLARLRRGDVGLVLMVGRDDLDRLAEHLPAEILDRHLGCRLAAGAGD